MFRLDFGLIPNQNLPAGDGMVRYSNLTVPYEQHDIFTISFTGGWRGWMRLSAVNIWFYNGSCDYIPIYGIDDLVPTP